MIRSASVSLGAAVCLVAGLAPAATAATMADQYDPYFDITPQVVEAEGGDSFSTPVFYELKGVPEGTTWDFLRGTASTYKGFCMAEKDPETGNFRAQLFNTDFAPLKPGVNTCDRITVRVNYPEDESSEYLDVQPELIPSDNMLYEPQYETKTADPGDRAELTPENRWAIALPENAEWELKVPAGRADWRAIIDPATGVITATVPKNANRGIAFGVVTTFSDGTVRKTTAHVNNTGIGAVFTPEVAPEEEPHQPGPEQVAGSTPLKTLAVIFGVLAVLGIAAAVAMPHLQQF
ncbi:hypothetical protein A0K93_07270 [Corynebacterium sp. BCW_4722]|nr:hypothetical protein A0K93_07270 [Corynebacterium sp. BCW_4722]